MDVGRLPSKVGDSASSKEVHFGYAFDSVRIECLVRSNSLALMSLDVLVTVGGPASSSWAFPRGITDGSASSRSLLVAGAGDGLEPKGTDGDPAST